MVFEAFALWRIFRLTAPSNLIDRSFKSTLVERCPINFKLSGLLALLQKHFSLRYLEQAVLNPHFSHLLVTKRRKGWPDKARDRGPRKRTVGYVEEADGVQRSQAGSLRRCRNEKR